MPARADTSARTALVTTSVAIAVPLLMLMLMLGASCSARRTPPLDAARLDIIHPRLWGRPEAVRTVLRSLGEAAAPTLFGYVSQYVFGGPGSAAANGSGAAGQRAANATGLGYAFLLFLIPLVFAGLLSLAALRTYPHDVATASASVQAISDSAEPGDRRAA